MEYKWKRYRIRHPTVYEMAVMDKLRKEKESERIRGYKYSWIIHTITWGVSSMSFGNLSWSSPTSDLYIYDCIKDILVMIIILDSYIYWLHSWLHWRSNKWGGHEIHATHHSYRFVGCWYFDHDSSLEAFSIALGVYGILAYYSPHMVTCFIYLWVVTVWSVVIHCGYNLPIFQFMDQYLPFINTPNCHELHHFHHLDGNHAAFFTVWDSIIGTHCRSDVSALTEFSNSTGKVKYGHELIDKDTGERNRGSFVSRQLLQRQSVRRRFRYNRDTSVAHLTAAQMKKFQTKDE